MKRNTGIPAIILCCAALAAVSCSENPVSFEPQAYTQEREVLRMAFCYSEELTPTVVVVRGGGCPEGYTTSVPRRGNNSGD